MSLTSRHICIEGCLSQLAKQRHTYPSVDWLINLAEGLLTHSSWMIRLGQWELEQRLRLQMWFIWSSCCICAPVLGPAIWPPANDKLCLLLTRPKMSGWLLHRWSQSLASPWILCPSVIPYKPHPSPSEASCSPPPFPAIPWWVMQRHRHLPFLKLITWQWDMQWDVPMWFNPTWKDHTFGAKVRKLGISGLFLFTFTVPSTEDNLAIHCTLPGLWEVQWKETSTHLKFRQREYLFCD